jgi:Tfp pilus assembly protein PilX
MSVPLRSPRLLYSRCSRARRLSDETGIALIMAIAVMLVLTVLVTSMIAYTSANSRDASLKQSGQSAYSLAEAGLNNALAQLYSHYYTNAGATNNNSTVYSASWFTSPVVTSQQAPGSAAACTSTSTCMSWGVVSWTVSGGSGITKGTLVLRGQGRVPNPTGGTALTRTVTEKIDVRRPPQLVQTPSYWSELYSGATGQACDLTLGQGVNASAPIYVAGNLCVLQAASIQTSGVTLKVLGNLRLQTGNSNIGKTSPVQSVQVGGGCVKATNGAYTTPCPINTSSTSIYDLSGRSTAPAPTADPLPAIDWAGVAAQQAAALTSCTNGVSLSAGTFYLTPVSGAGSTGYSCSITDPTGSVTLGSITYNSVAHTVALSGEIYFSGNLDLSTTTTPVTYTGIASTFVAGTVTAANGSGLCVHVASGTCDFANATNTSSPDYWDATKSVLIIQAQGGITGTNLAFQGALYSAAFINLGGGQSSTQGPLVSPQIITPGQQLNLSFPQFPLVYSGTLGTPPPPYTLSSAYGGSF